MQIKWFGIDGFDGMIIFFVGLFLFLIGLAVSFVILVLLWSTLVALIERFVFYSRLKIACRGTTLRCKKKHTLLRSFFNSYGGSDFIIYKDGKEALHLKFFPYFIRTRQSFLWENGVLERRFRLIFWKRTNFWITGRGSRELTAAHWFFFWLNVFHSYRKPKLDFDQTNAPCILLIPNDDILLSFSVKNKAQVIDNGVELRDGITFYAQKRLIEKLKDI